MESVSTQDTGWAQVIYELRLSQAAIGVTLFLGRRIFHYGYWTGKGPSALLRDLVKNSLLVLRDAVPGCSRCTRHYILHLLVNLTFPKPRGLRPSLRTV